MNATNTAIIDQIKREITADITEGTVPADITRFTELRDYVDVTAYADALVSEREEAGTWVGSVNEVLDSVDAWLRDGRPAFTA